MVHEAKNLDGTHSFNPAYTSNSHTELILCSRVLFEKLTVTQLIKQLPAIQGTIKLITLFKKPLNGTHQFLVCVNTINSLGRKTREIQKLVTSTEAG